MARAAPPDPVGFQAELDPTFSEAVEVAVHRGARAERVRLTPAGLPAADIAVGERWRCRATLADGEPLSARVDCRAAAGEASIGLGCWASGDRRASMVLRELGGFEATVHVGCDDSTERIPLDQGE
ncbi:MAG: hypothetical protein SFX73_38010 [Kofleriaceae bacterium]|nr:hypothetical protein [Kofleriaceae bacterium]